MVNFDSVIDRHGTGSLKWDKYLNEDIIPMWVADMDFQAPQPVLTAIKDQVDFGILGYHLPPKELVELICTRLFDRYNWTVDPSWIILLPGLVCGINLACRSCGHQNSKIITLTPIYPPFLSAPSYSERKLITIPMQNINQHWTIPLDDLENNISEDCKLFLLCNPQNPTGRVFNKKELTEISSFCLKHDLVLCSDEIHCDLVYSGNKHIPIASLNTDIENRTITLMSPSKTFNIPGLGCSFAIIPNRSLRSQFCNIKKGIVPEINTLGYTAGLACYKHGASWVNELMEYLTKNRDFVIEKFNNEINGTSLNKIEATYLAWIDIRNLNIKNTYEFFYQHGVGISDGVNFGKSGFFRLNFGCPKSILEKGIDRVKYAIESI